MNPLLTTSIPGWFKTRSEFDDLQFFFFFFNIGYRNNVVARNCKRIEKKEREARVDSVVGSFRSVYLYACDPDE